MSEYSRPADGSEGGARARAAWPASCLAEITAARRRALLPAVGERVSGQVIRHADHNRQVKIKLAGWKVEA